MMRFILFFCAVVDEWRIRTKPIVIGLIYPCHVTLLCPAENVICSAGPTSPDVFLPWVITLAPEELLQIYCMADGSCKSTAYRKLKTSLSSNRIDANPFDTAGIESHCASWTLFFFFFLPPPLPAVHTTWWQSYVQTTGCTSKLIAQPHN